MAISQIQTNEDKSHRREDARAASELRQRLLAGLPGHGASDAMDGVVDVDSVLASRAFLETLRMVVNRHQDRWRIS